MRESCVCHVAWGAPTVCPPFPPIFSITRYAGVFLTKEVKKHRKRREEEEQGRGGKRRGAMDMEGRDQVSKRVMLGVQAMDTQRRRPSCWVLGLSCSTFMLGGKAAAVLGCSGRGCGWREEKLHPSQDPLPLSALTSLGLVRYHLCLSSQLPSFRRPWYCSLG